MKLAAAVFAGGCAGGLLRTVLVRGVAHSPGTWPWTTFLVNVAGALALGAIAARSPVGTTRRALLGTGACGALTTFSTLQLEVVLMLRDGHAALAAGYVAASLAAGLLAVRLGRRAVAA